MSNFGASVTQEKQFAIQLRKVAAAVGAIIAKYTNGAEITDQAKMTAALRQYAETLRPWAEVTTGKILQSVNHRNARAWAGATKDVSRGLRETVNNNSVGAVLRLLQQEQIDLIQSLPLEAGLRAQDLALEAMIGGKRADVVAAELARTGHVTKSRATMIARTEIARANATLTQSRASVAGISSYIWRTVGDADVRPSHAAMDGKVCAFASPPLVEGEGHHGPGEYPNCRCYPDPIIADAINDHQAALLFDRQTVRADRRNPRGVSDLRSGANHQGRRVALYARGNSGGGTQRTGRIHHGAPQG